MKNKLKFNALSIMPIMLLFGYLLSNLGIKLFILIPISFLTIFLYVLITSKLIYNKIIVLFILFSLWVTFLYFMGNAEDKFKIYFGFILSCFMAIGIYYYSYYTTNIKFIYYIYTFLIVSFIIAFLEVNYGLVLPSSGKALDKTYGKVFEKIPSSTFYNPNDFATAIGIVFIYIYSYCKIMNYNIRYMILLISLYTIYCAESRGVLISMILLPLVYCVVNKRPLRKILLGYLLIFVGLTFLFINKMLSSKYIDIIENFIQGQTDNSFLIRWQMIVYTFSNFEKFIIGYGPGGCSLFFHNFSILHPHNLIIEILVEYGYLGLILTFILFFLSIKSNYKIIIDNNISENLYASCKATIILFYLFIIFSVVPSSLLNYWPFAWFPVYLTLINLGLYKRHERQMLVENNVQISMIKK